MENGDRKGGRGWSWGRVAPGHSPGQGLSFAPYFCPLHLPTSFSSDRSVSLISSSYLFCNPSCVFSSFSPILVPHSFLFSSLSPPYPSLSLLPIIIYGALAVVPGMVWGSERCAAGAHRLGSNDLPWSSCLGPRTKQFHTHSCMTHALSSMREVLQRPRTFPRRSH